ncbi:MAG: hypothetical protein IJ228_12735 [Succinivibrio sp.]|nr:hypothetical protein [Succinivibrio sp.]
MKIGRALLLGLWLGTIPAISQAADETAPDIRSAAALYYTGAQSKEAAPLPVPWAPWELYENFKQQRLNPSGRVISTLGREGRDGSSSAEAQAYGMFFALINNDQELFARLWQFVKGTLTEDSVERLPAALYGYPKKGTENKPVSGTGPSQGQAPGQSSGQSSGSGPRILDRHGDAHAALFLAYDLLEAARLWQDNEYAQSAHQIMTLIKSQCTLRDPVLGTLLTPDCQHDSRVLRPAAYPLFVLERLSREDTDFKDIAHDTVHSLLKAAGSGFWPEYARYNAEGDFLLGPATCFYTDSLRAYLWVSLTNQADPNYRLVKDALKRSVFFISLQRDPINKVFLYDDTRVGFGGPAHASAYLHFLPPGLGRDYLRLSAFEHRYGDEEYLGQILALFAQGFDERRFALAPDGTLQVYFTK